MNSKKRFENFDGRLRIEALLRSALSGIAIGAAIALVSAFVTWFLAFDGLITAILLFVFGSVVGGVAFYFTVFRPTVVKNARRLDRYGLDERLITMVEYGGDDSYIAQKQREDALAALKQIEPKRIKLKVPRVVIILSVVFSLLFVGMAAVEGLSQAGILPTGKEVWDTLFPPPPPEQYKIEYTVSAGGYLVGNAEQRVIEGQSTEPVLAVAEEGYMFYAWSDGKTDPHRFDENISKSQTFVALFIEVEDPDNEEEDGDKPDDVPGNSGSSGGDNPDSNQGSGKYLEVNQIIDGETYYRDVYEEYYRRATEMLAEGKEIPDYIRAIIEAYYRIIQ